MRGGAACGLVLALGAVKLKSVDDWGSQVVEGSVSGLRAQPLPAGVPAAADLRNRTAGSRCVLASGVRPLSVEAQPRTAGPLRGLSVHNTRRVTGRSVGEIVRPRTVLNEVDWAWEDLPRTTVDGVPLKVMWHDGVCAPVGGAADSELCVHVPAGGGLLGDTAVTQAWQVVRFFFRSTASPPNTSRATLRLQVSVDARRPSGSR